MVPTYNLERMYEVFLFLLYETKEEFNQYMNEYLKIYHQDSTLHFAGFEKAFVRLYQNKETSQFKATNLIDIELKCCLQNKVSNERFDFIQTAALNLYQFPTNLSDSDGLEELTIEIPEAPLGEKQHNSDIFMYLGFGVTITQSSIYFKKFENDYFINWKGIAEDIDYYDERAKPNTFDLVAKIERIQNVRTTDIIEG